jgi:hypothetical protein
MKTNEPNNKPKDTGITKDRRFLKGKALTDSEIETILAGVGREKRGLVLAGLYTGTRQRCETSVLTWKKVDLNNKLLHFPSASGSV